ncbi:hypothetical protein [Flagellimonas meridianipacifica]|uniref:Adhesin domain-containing protein n=1 Tax=Flagellimonas meridianipacifica TaxID=1080225 RepID=A0A2T0M9B4_9FLAO|nr:hypothetical protein [Allomuricauda pacifica]PRX54127.1 hypothetical protein CLV81_2523 [Allomuricauda pacifica]
MNRNRLIVFSLCMFLVHGLYLHGQDTQSKTYKETFTVNPDAVLDIDTSHADIEFETWNKNQVEITAVVELEGATEEEAENYLKKDVVQIVGNSKEIEVSTKGRSWSVYSGDGDWDFDYNYNVEVLPHVAFVEPLIESLQIPELPEVLVIPELPPMPPIPQINFDYDAYRERGDEYLEEWKKEFDKNFDKKYKVRYKEWSERVKKLAEEREEQRAKLREQREEIREQARAIREEAREKREELREERNKSRSQRVIRLQNDGSSNEFYFSTNGENKKYKVKKRIKIKMPKSIKLKMNVRHGEVKLAANTKNLKASLSYASLLASTIDGDRTDIQVSYSPVVVQKWNYGQLRTNYSDRVDLKEVKELSLNSVSSKVVIGHLVDKALVKNNLGKLHVNSVANGFNTIDISVENGEVDFKMPSVPFNIYVNETTSDIRYPQVLEIGKSKNYNTNVYKGYYIRDDGKKSININSKYSEVVLKQ